MRRYPDVFGIRRDFWQQKCLKQENLKSWTNGWRIPEPLSDRRQVTSQQPNNRTASASHQQRKDGKFGEWRFGRTKAFLLGDKSFFFSHIKLLEYLVVVVEILESRRSSMILVHINERSNVSLLTNVRVYMDYENICVHCPWALLVTPAETKLCITYEREGYITCRVQSRKLKPISAGTGKFGLTFR